jgi:hypothetical protein
MNCGLRTSDCGLNAGAAEPPLPGPSCTNKPNFRRAGPRAPPTSPLWPRAFPGPIVQNEANLARPAKRPGPRGGETCETNPIRPSRQAGRVPGEAKCAKRTQFAARRTGAAGPPCKTNPISGRTLGQTPYGVTTNARPQRVNKAIWPGLWAGAPEGRNAKQANSEEVSSTSFSVKPGTRRTASAGPITKQRIWPVGRGPGERNVRNEPNFRLVTWHGHLARGYKSWAGCQGQGAIVQNEPNLPGRPEPWRTKCAKRTQFPGRNWGQTPYGVTTTPGRVSGV